MIMNALDAQKLTKKHNIFIEVEKKVETELIKMAEQGYDYCIVTDINEHCPRVYTKEEWYKRVKKHFEELGYYVEMINTANGKIRLEW